MTIELPDFSVDLHEAARRSSKAPARSGVSERRPLARRETH